MYTGKWTQLCNTVPYSRIGAFWRKTILTPVLHHHLAWKPLSSCKYYRPCTPVRIHYHRALRSGHIVQFRSSGRAWTRYCGWHKTPPGTRIDSSLDPKSYKTPLEKNGGRRVCNPGCSAQKLSEGTVWSGWCDPSCTCLRSRVPRQHRLDLQHGKVSFLAKQNRPHLSSTYLPRKTF